MDRYNLYIDLLLDVLACLAGSHQDDKASLPSFSFSYSIFEYILAYRRKRVGFNTCSELKGALRDKFGVGKFKRLECSQAMGNSKGEQEIYILFQVIEKEESMKPSLLEKSSMGNELLQARIEIEESVEIHDE
ncbi:hypothetical protein M9H77_29638 [Catharanthus roseus]|uniref:Uncharacterized protein n=1 Tax=Catharanthus roseus TaxID=4058 RepID=A0ACB9ZVC7_CATRO|nr:hypothetical protein M9H77_29638 [Catharanthus roseus]